MQQQRIIYDDTTVRRFIFASVLFAVLFIAPLWRVVSGGFLGRGGFVIKGGEEGGLAQDVIHVPQSGAEISGLARRCVTLLPAARQRGEC